MPYIHLESPVSGGDGVTGLGDINQSFFFSPKDTVGGWIVGFGPVFLYPSASIETLGSEKWGAGPTGVALKQDNGFTYGMLFYHIWSFAGNDQRADVNATYLQPFVSYTTKTYTTFGVNTESTYDWENRPVDCADQRLGHPDAEDRRPAAELTAGLSLLRRSPG